ncbi:hypothetical protein CPLU01_02136 [Colletotrichum plurivorum]|uniref:Uncharacterized protein n=1 Tax=Colletotrichum plurivorum TaxID=2175906 RepID=A0A8H6KX44_9PEZI|nr:hypothetical protein CPLU01_02136 [Colletotrichum plurivorum]
MQTDKTGPCAGLDREQRARCAGGQATTCVRSVRRRSLIDSSSDMTDSEDSSRLATAAAAAAATAVLTMKLIQGQWQKAEVAGRGEAGQGTGDKFNVRCPARAGSETMPGRCNPHKKAIVRSSGVSTTSRSDVSPITNVPLNKGRNPARGWSEGPPDW